MTTKFNLRSEVIIMAKKKAKWLEGSTVEVLAAIAAALGVEEVTDKEITKAQKGIAELQERFAVEEEEPSVLGILAKASEALTEVNGLLDQAGGIYQEEVEAEEEDDVEEVEAEEVDEDDDEEDDEDDLESMSKKDLKALAKEKGIKVSKKDDKASLIKKIQDAE